MLVYAFTNLDVSLSLKLFCCELCYESLTICVHFAVVKNFVKYQGHTHINASS